MTSTARQRASRHAERAHACSCGKVVFGNGGKYQHREMHRRRKDAHHYITHKEFRRRFPDYRVGGQ